MSLLVELKNYYPKDYCYQCIFYKTNHYGEAYCLLDNEYMITSPDYEKPAWCPLDNAKEVGC